MSYNTDGFLCYLTFRRLFSEKVNSKSLMTSLVIGPQTPQEDLAVMSDSMEGVLETAQESADPTVNEPEEQMQELGEEPEGNVAEIEDEDSKNSEDKQVIRCSQINSLFC